MAKSLDIIDPKKDLKSPEEDEKEDVFEQRPPSSSGGVFYLVLGIIALVVAVAVALYILYKDSNPTPASQASATAAVVKSVNTSITPTSTTSIALSTPSPATDTITFKYTNQQIRIANGNSISGEASKIKKVLEDAGFKVASIGNASRSYSESLVYYKTGQQDLAEALKNTIKNNYNATIKEDNAVVGSYDAVIVLGSK